MWSNNSPWNIVTCCATFGSNKLQPERVFDVIVEEFWPALWCKMWFNSAISPSYLSLYFDQATPTYGLHKMSCFITLVPLMSESYNWIFSFRISWQRAEFMGSFVTCLRLGYSFSEILLILHQIVMRFKPSRIHHLISLQSTECFTSSISFSAVLFILDLFHSSHFFCLFFTVKSQWLTLP